MNRKQEIVMWIVGIVVAVVCLYNGVEHGDWLFAYVIPAIIFGGLVFHRLRSPGSPSPSPATVVSALAIAALVVVLHQARSTSSAVDAHAYEIENVGSRVEDVESSVEDVKSAVDSVESRIDDLEQRLSWSR